MSQMSVEEAITGRYSARAFLPREVPRETIERILKIAGRSPSGSNIQPWKVYVLAGKTLADVKDDLVRRHKAGDEGKPEYNYYNVNWRDPYLARRRATGWGLYQLHGVAKGDIAGGKEVHRRNFVFFDAPVGFIFTIDRDLERGAWLDYGMFMNAIMLTARSFGLETCGQAAFCQYHAVLQERLSIPKEEMIVVGMAIGYADPDAKVNSYRTERIGLDEFVKWV